MNKKMRLSDEGRVLKAIKRPKRIILICTLLYIIIAGMIVNSTILDAQIQNGKCERKRADEELLALTISPQSITKILNGSSELHTDGAFVLDDANLYCKNQQGDHYFRYRNAIYEKGDPFSELITQGGYIIDGIMINAIDDNTILVHPSEWSWKKDDLCTYSWHEKMYTDSELNRDAVCEILRRQETSSISVGEAAAIIGLVKDGVVLGYYDGCVLFSDHRSGNEVEFTWITRESKEYRMKVKNANLSRPMMGIGDFALYVDQEGYLNACAFGKSVRFISEVLKQDMPLVSYNAYLDDPIGKGHQTLHVEILSKEAVLSLTLEPSGSGEYTRRLGIGDHGYENILGNRYQLVLWNEYYHWKRWRRSDGSLESY